MAGEIRVWKQDDLLKSDRLVVYGRGFRDTALRPFNPAENAMKGVLEQVAAANVENIEITSEGERHEKNRWGIAGVYYVVEALEVTFVEPSSENIKKVLTENTPSFVEFNSAISHAAKSPDSKEFAKILLTRIKRIINTKLGDIHTDTLLGDNKRLIKLNDLMLSGYATIMQKEAAPELAKILKFHAVDDVRVSAGRQLIKLGDAGLVEEAIERNEKSDKVKVALKKALME
jgi:hypothetical protein